jgi:hypothetical protein
MGLPPLYDTWVNTLLGSSPPEETQATCHDFAMCKRPEVAQSSPTFYDPRTKCCTYFPRLPNFLVGRILAETDPGMREGVALVAARVAAGSGATPLELSPTVQHQLLYAAGKTNTFGRSVALRCPYYDTSSGGCGVWRHRNAICATYFCKHDRGALGRRFWNELGKLFTRVEEELAVHCVLELGFGEEAIRRLVGRVCPEAGRPAEIDPGETDGERAAGYRELWGAWDGREAELYAACAAIVGRLSWSDALAIAGARARLQAAEVANAYRALASDHIPAALRLGQFRTRPGVGDSVCLEGYSGSDEIAAPRVILEVLPYFDGRPVDQVLRHVEAETGVAMDHDFIRKLVDFGILGASET